MNIEFEELTHDNLPVAMRIDRDDIPEDFVDYAETIWKSPITGLSIIARGTPGL